MRTSKKIVSLVLAVMMVMSMIVVGTVSASALDYVAENLTSGGSFTTLEAAIAAAQDGDYIILLDDCEGNGIVFPQDKFPTGLTVDFSFCTYTVSGTPVGSKGTETSAFQLLKGNKIEFCNGTITADCTVNPRNGKTLLRMIQNYSDLTLDGMTVSMVGAYYDQTTMATANGSTTINDSTINAPDFSRYGSAYSASDFGGAALNEGTFSTYQSVSVTVTGHSVINGDVKIDDDNNKPFALNLEGGTINGGITLDDNAQAAIDDPSVGASIDKGDNFKVYVAKIGNTYYEKVTEAFAAAHDGDKIDIIGDSKGAGVKVVAGRFPTNGINVDFHEHTYTIDSTLVGSTGYESQAFHLEKNNKITLGYGTITSENARMLVQNYSDLTLKNMTLTPNNPNYNNYYTLSNNCGNVVINNTTINANPTPGSFAFDVCRYSSYPSVNVTVKGDSVINGDIEVSASKSDPKDGFSLTLESGTMNGDIVLDQTAKNVMDATPEKAKVTKKASFAQDAPEGYEWVDGGAGQVLQRAIADQAWIKGFDNNISEPAVRIWTNLDRTYLDANADDYGYVVAKVSGKEQATANFSLLTADGGNGQKVISCKGTYNQGVGHNSTKDITLKVTGMEDGNQVAARFYYVINGVTYYADYVNVQTYDGIIATYTV
ncbi:MAG: hypothetical protein IJT79_04720 [Ruminococcus sp.]|nr:hypothetical protein [Ruminococcus sp.]